MVIERPETTPGQPQHLCADKAYDGKEAIQIIVARDILLTSGAVVKKSRRKKIVPGYRAPRRVVEVCHSWFNRFRKLLVRDEKTDSSYVALHHVAAAIICWRKIGVIYGKALNVRKTFCHAERSEASHILIFFGRFAPSE
jgi:hypothetical protein